MQRAIKYREIAAQYLLLWCVAVILGCSGVQPQTFRQQVAYVEGGLTAAYQTIGQLKVSQRIDAVKRDKLVAQADTVSTSLDAVYVALAAGNQDAAANSLILARSALLALQQALKEVK